MVGRGARAGDRDVRVGAAPAYHVRRIPPDPRPSPRVLSLTPRPLLSPSIHTHSSRFGLVPFLAALLLLAGCGSKNPVAKPVLPPPPEVVGTMPGARSTGVPYDTPIWLDFGTDMDAGTMTASNVFLKLDTQRAPIATSWDPASRRLRIVPTAPLALRRTYTVEIGPGMKTAEGASIGAGAWFFQFGTNAARRPGTPRPHVGDANESPFVMVSWDSTELSAGNISYELWSGLDSAAVAARSGTPTTIVTRSRWLPAVAWPFGQRVFWSVTVVNATLGERLDGPVQSFTTIPAGLVEDSLIVKANDYGYSQITNQSPVNPYQSCSQDSVVSAAGITCWFQFPIGALPADVHVASARIEAYLWPHDLDRLAVTPVFAWSSKYGWIHPCKPALNFPDQLPSADQQLATGRQVTAGGRLVVFQSDLLASHVEASVRRGGFFGYQLTSAQRFAWVTPHSISDVASHPFLKIHYYRTGPEPLAIHAP